MHKRLCILMHKCPSILRESRPTNSTFTLMAPDLFQIDQNRLQSSRYQHLILLLKGLSDLKTLPLQTGENGQALMHWHCTVWRGRSRGGIFRRPSHMRKLRWTRPHYSSSNYPLLLSISWASSSCIIITWVARSRHHGHDASRPALLPFSNHTLHISNAAIPSRPDILTPFLLIPSHLDRSTLIKVVTLLDLCL